MFTRPEFGRNIVMATLPMMAQERKCGRYRIVWDTFLNLGYLNSFRISARMIGIGKPMIRSARLNTMELRSALMKSASLNILTNVFMPTHSLPAYPFAGL